MSNSLQGTTTTPKETTPAKKPSVLEGLVQLQKSPKYQALPAEKKLEVRGHVYDKYIEPYLKSRGVDTKIAGTKDRWVNQGVGKITGPLPGAPTLKEKGEDLLTHWFAAEGKGGTKTLRGLLKTHQAGTHWGAEALPYVRSFEPIKKKLLDKYDAYVNKGQTWLNAREDLANTMLGSNYNANLMTKTVELPSRVFGTVLEHPGYIAATEGIGAVGGLLGGEAAFTEKLLDGSATSKYAYKALKGAAEGYLGGRMEGESPEEAKRTAAGFVAFEGVLTGAGKLLGTAPVKNTVAYLGKVLGIGGANLLKKSVDAVAQSTPEAIEKATTEKLSGSLVKATAKSLNQVAQDLGYKDFWDAQAKGKSSEVIGGLTALAKQANKEVAVHNPDLVAAQADQDIKELQQNPLGQSFLKILQANGSNPVKDIVNHVVESTKAVSGAPLEQSTVGAAAANSLEFSDNVSKLIKSNVDFESRTHKFLGALSALMDEADAKGGKMSKSDNELFNAIQNQLDQDPVARGKTLAERRAAGENVHKHIDAIFKKGNVDPKGRIRFWRSTEVWPGEVPTGAQRELQAKLGQIEGAEHKVGDMVRIGNTKLIGKVVEAYKGHVTIEAPSGAKFSLSNKEVFDAGMKKTEIAEEFARRREQANKITEMKKAEEALAKRQAAKQALEEKKGFKEATQKVGQEVEELKKEDPKLYISKTHIREITEELINRGLKGEELLSSRRQMLKDFFGLVKAGAKREEAINAVRDNKVQELLDRLLKESQKVDTTTAADDMAQARKELGESATPSQLLLRAQEIKVARGKK